MLFKTLFIFTNILFLFCTITAQDKCPTKFEKINLTDFTDKYPGIDSTAGAFVIADMGRSSFETNSKEWFSIVFKRFTRIRINNSSAYDLATVSIPLYSNSDNDEEKIRKIEAYTYNLENGEIIKQKLKKEDIVKEKSGKGLVIQKFTLPNVKAGSIIEYEYTMQSDFLFNLQPWIFQGEYPCIWSEYEVAIPAFFNYSSILKGYFAFDIQKQTSNNNTYNVRQSQGNGIYARTEVISIPTNDNVFRWVVKNIPTIKLEKFTSSLKNHIQSISFQRNGQQFPGGAYTPIMDDWATACNKLMTSSSFGDEIYKRNGWISNETKDLLADSKTPLEKAKKIFNYVKNNYKCDDEDYGIYLTSNLKDVSKKKAGSIADVNLLLAAMLDYENINVRLAMLSTRWHGKVYPFLPILQNYNYVVCDAFIDGKHYFLDASSPINGFNKLPQECYNEFVVSIEKDKHSNFILSADSLTESKTTIINLAMANKDASQWKGNVSSNLGFYESMGIRLLALKKGEAEAKKQIEKEYSFPFAAKNIEFLALKNYEESATTKYDFTLENEGGKEILFLNPLIKEGTSNNYFKAEDRNYPVEMPYKIDENIIVVIQVPEGYILDEKPKNIRVKMTGDKASFNYIIDAKDDEITLTTNIKFNQANFTVDDYYDLQAFMDFVVKKHAEQLVFKKK